MDKATPIECVRRYADIVRENFDVKRVILFGSYAKDRARKDSDIDAAVVLDASNDRSGFLEEILKTRQVIYSTEPLP